jgi:hypothetical protein
MTGRGLYAARDASFLPDPNVTEKRLPLERLTLRRTSQCEELGATFLNGQLGEVAHKNVCTVATTEAEDYAALILLEERLLIAWVEDYGEAVSSVTAESRRRIDSMANRLRTSVPDEPPPGLREWPAEPAT